MSVRKPNHANRFDRLALAWMVTRKRQTIIFHYDRITGRIVDGVGRSYTVQEATDMVRTGLAQADMNVQSLIAKFGRV